MMSLSYVAPLLITYNDGRTGHGPGCSSQVPFRRAGCTYLRITQCFYTLSEAIEAAKKAVKEFEYLVIDGPANDARKFAPRLEDYDGLCIFESYLKAAQRMDDVLAVAQVFELIAQVLAHERDATSVRLRYESALKDYKAQSIVNSTFRYWMSGREGNSNE